uniref:Uncharacterized protein n=1 Tax=Zea mays TaxID=4577 RepID=A0A804QRI3_MAIZE
EPHRPERGDRERQRQEHQRRERDHGVGQHVGDAAVGVVRGLAEVDVALLHEHRQRVGAHVEHGGHGHGEEAQALLHALGRVVEAPEDGGQDEAGDHDGAEAHDEELRHAARVGEGALDEHPHLGPRRVGERWHRRRGDRAPGHQLPAGHALGDGELQRHELAAAIVVVVVVVVKGGSGTAAVLPLDVEVGERGGAVGAALVLADGVERELGRVLVVRDGRAEVGEEGLEPRGRAGVHGAPPREQEQPVEDGEDARAGLVDGHDDDAAAARDAAEHLHDHEGAGGVEARGGLVEEQQDGVVDDVGADGHAAALAARHPAVGLVADDGVGGAGEAELVDERVDARALAVRGQRAGQAELGGEQQRLAHRQHRVQQVVLHHVRGDGAQPPALQRLPVQRGPAAAEAVPRDAPRQRVQQRRLARPARAHHREQLPLPGLPGDAVQQRLGVPGGAGGGRGRRRRVQGRQAVAGPARRQAA